MKEIPMSRETEKVFAELHKAMEGKDFQSENDINTFINQFIQNYNQNVDKKTEYDEYDYLDMAQNAFDVKESIRYAQKALKLHILL